MNKYLKYFILIVIIIVISLNIYNLFINQKQETETKPVLLENEFLISEDILKNYKITTVKVGEIPEFEKIVLPGVISYDLSRTAKVGSRVSGRIENIYVNEGDYVNKGKVLLSIASIELGEMEAKYKKAVTKKESLTAHLERIKDLYEKKIVAAKDYESVLMEYKTAKTEVDNSFNALLSYGLSSEEISQILSGNTYSLDLKIRAPISGTITERNAILGQAVTPNETLFTISDLSKVWIILEVFEKDLNNVAVGQYADISPVGSSDVYRAKVTHVGQIIDANTRSAEIRLELDNKNKIFRPGQSVSSVLHGLSQKVNDKIKALPLSSIHKIEGQNYVFIRLTTNKFKAIPVEIGKIINDKIEILSQIDPNAEIVTEGSYILKSEFLKI